MYTPDQPLEDTDAPSGKSKIAILFSGGLDCTVIARLAHEALPPNEPIDLLNVAFENPRVLEARANDLAAPKKSKTRIKNSGIPPGEFSTEDTPASVSTATSILVDPYSICPDRITCLSSFRELQKTCPTRKFNLILINVPLTETLSHRRSVISLIHPHNTEMDLSIALAFYFASRGQGILYTSDSPQDSTFYNTPARILLSGLGADELFAGYARHRTAFLRSGYSALISELLLDVGRLGKRNLGRDDRVISQWGKEGRYPYLDECVVAWTLAQPVWAKCDFDAPSPGGQSGEIVGDGLEGGKKVLRLVAQMLGMYGVARETKRAIQFGARTAKMESNPGGGRVKGTRILS